MKRVLLLLGCLVTATLYAQPLHLQQLSVAHGLSQNTVNCILKDQRGYIWIGTNDGLNRYDGYESTIFRYQPQDSTSLLGNKIYALIEDKNGDIWVGTHNGLCRYDRNKGHFKRYSLPEGSNDQPNRSFIRTLQLDRHGNLWVGTLANGLYRLYPQHNTIERLQLKHPHTHQALKHFSALLGAGPDHLWLGTNESFLFKLNIDDLSLIAYPFPELEGTVVAKNLYQDSEGTLWVGTEGKGLYLFNPVNLTFTHLHKENSGLLNNVVKAIIEDSDRNIWIATDGAGIHRWHPKTRKFSYLQSDIHSPNSLSSNAIYSLLQDEQGIMWIGTFDGGVCIYNKHRKNFQHISSNTNPDKGLRNRSVLSFLEDRKGRIWVGTDGGGISLFDKKTQSFTHLHAENTPKLKSNVIPTLYQSQSGDIWVGTYIGGLYKLDESLNIQESYVHDEQDPNSLTNNNVWDIVENKEGKLWIGTLGGLELFDPHKGTFTHIPTQGGTRLPYYNRVTTLYLDSHQKLWVGGKGLKYYDPNTQKLHHLRGELGNILSEYDIRALLEDSRGNFLIGTEGGGLYVYNRSTHEYAHFQASDSLPNNAIHSIQENPDGTIWVSTNYGISSFELPSDPYAAESKTHLVFRNYTKEDGLQSNQFSYGAGLTTSDGELFFGGINGFNYFNTLDIKDNPFTPQVEITALKIHNEYASPKSEHSPISAQISELETLSLSYQEARVFSLEFTALNYTAPEKNRYAYMLEGFMDSWSYVDGQRSATFTNLDQGEYLFRVKAANNDGKWNTQGKSLRIIIRPPFWKTSWAYFIYTLIFLSMLLALRLVLLTRERMRHDIELKELEKQKVVELNQLKLSFFTNVSHEFRTPLSLITAPIEYLLESNQLNTQARKQLQLIQRNANRLNNLVSQLLDFRKLEHNKPKLELESMDLVFFLKQIKDNFDAIAQKKQINLKFEHSVEHLSCAIDCDKLEKILSNLLSNAFKFTPIGGRITIAMEYEQTLSARSMHLYVKDNGIGIAPANQGQIFERFYQAGTPHPKESRGSGIGLYYTKALVELLGGKISLASEEGKGSCFKVSLPLKSCNSATPARNNGHTLGFSHTESLSIYSDAQLSPLYDADFKTDKPILLFVEDNQDLHGFIEDAFHECYQIVHAFDGQQGAELAMNLIPDVVLSDVMMPRKNGISLCKTLKEDIRTCHIPVILLTANTQESNWLQGLETGADAYLTKPFSLPILSASLRNLIENRKMLKAHFSKDFVNINASEIKSADSDFLKTAIDIVEQHIEDPEFGVGQFAECLGMSRSVMYRKFSALTDQSVKEFINMIRLKRAEQLLRSGNKRTVSEVAYAVGFNDAQYFSKKFKKYFNSTPSQYLQQQQKSLVKQ